ncbi:hypothetical protein [Endozoicomonas sp. YOMI1]|nr:hypothetical protein [Endozoicomonas sp. YOMI1]
MTITNGDTKLFESHCLTDEDDGVCRVSFFPVNGQEAVCSLETGQ